MEICKYLLPCGYCENTGTTCKIYKEEKEKCKHDWILVYVDDFLGYKCYLCKNCLDYKKESI